MISIRWVGLLVTALLICAFPAQVRGAESGAAIQDQASQERDASDSVKEAVSGSERLKAADPDYADAMKLVARNDYHNAQQLLEKLIERYPSDPAVMRALGCFLIMTNPAVKEPESRRKQRARARRLLAQAKELGADDSLTDYYLSAVPDDGGDDHVFSNHEEVNEAMHEGEAAFARKDFNAAIAAYTRAMMFDPNLYEAVLFIGDSYYASGRYAGAGEWFFRASLIDPDRETAYRYWGDALMHQGNMQEARTKFIEAIIAEPYKRLSWVGLTQWARINDVPLAHPDINPPSGPSKRTGEDGKTVITLDMGYISDNAEKDGTFGWAIYPIVRGAWQMTFEEKFPEEPEYRHTLAEEEMALSLVAESVASKLEENLIRQEDLDPGIAALVKIHQAGLLEAYILISRPDEGIAQDYISYRKEHRDMLRRYLDEFLVPKVYNRKTLSSD
ncbi:MAG TPA: tetratricopeptide repeat protein [Acidobacteriota bacterium]|nr:tetratricopeptide repeat protein [Acidobacteriota bacterium]